MFSRYCNFENFRNIIEFKHVRLKSSCKSLNKEKLSKEDIKYKSEILHTILNCNVHTAAEIVKKNMDLGNMSYYDLNQNAKFCKNFFKLSDVIEFPKLLSLQPSSLQHRYFSLKELGFTNIAPSYIVRFSHILKKTPKELQKKGFPLICEHKSKILDDYLIAFKRTEVSNKLQQMYKNGSDFQKIKEVMNAEFLSAKLRCPIGTAYEMLRKSAALRVQSILNTNQLLDILLFRFGITVNKISKFAYMLSLHHESVESLLSEFPEILGVDTRFLIRRMPVLLKQDYDSIRETEAILRRFDIIRDQLMCCPKVLSISSTTLDKRLTALCNKEDFAVLKSNKKFLWLVYYYKNLNFRLQRLKAKNIEFECSISMFTSSREVFEKCLVYNHDFCNTPKSISESYAYFANVFKMNGKEVLNRLKHLSHNFRLIINEDSHSEKYNFSMRNSRRVIEFLLLSGVSKEQIFNGLEIVCFDINIVKDNFQKMENHPLCQPYKEWILHYNFIHLLIYIIKVSNYNIECDCSLENDEPEHKEYLEFYSNSSL